METKTIAQNQLSSECWLVQMGGTDRCNTCEFKGKRACGGKSILKTGKNKSGFAIGAKGLENFKLQNKKEK